MKKILAAFDGTEYSEGASQYAIELAKASNSLLVGAFINDLRHLNYAYSFALEQPYMDVSGIEEAQKEEREKIDLNIKLFNRACSAKGVHHKVHLEKGVPLQEILKETAYADILIIDSHTGFFSFSNDTPSQFLKDILADSHCPVLTVPHQYSSFDKIILCYDGTPSSIYAIKMFAYLFPELHNKETTVLSVNENPSNHVKEGSNLKELVKQHYDEANYEVLKGNAKDELIEFLKTKGEHAIVVMGSYGRNALSRLFQQSMSNRIIKELNAPVFVAHQ